MKKKRTPAGRPESQRAPLDDDRDDDRPGERPVRLNRYLAQNGIASRRKADELITAGDVTVDGKIVSTLGTKVDPARDRVEVNGVVLRPHGERPRYYVLSKPSGVVCTNDPKEARRRAIDLITDRGKGRIYTVGRLDEDSTGLVILTNDGEFANRISHPRYEIAKTYRVTLRGRIDHETVAKLRQGVRLSDFRSSFSRVKVLKRTEQKSIVLVTLEEGRNREIRRVFARLGYGVKELRRVRIGNLTDRGLKIGEWRPLTRSEVAGLLEMTRGSERAPARRAARSASARTSQGRSPRVRRS